MGKRKNANKWKSKMFSKFQDMVLIKGEDRTDGIYRIEKRKDDFYGCLVAFFVDDYDACDVEYYTLDEIKILQHPVSERIEDKRIYMGNLMLSKVSQLLYFGNNVRIIYENGDYQTVDAKLLKKGQKETKQQKWRERDKKEYTSNIDKGNIIDKSSYNSYSYPLKPDKMQREKLDLKIKDSNKKDRFGNPVYAYEPEELVEEIIKYKGKTKFVEIVEVGNVKMDSSEFPTGNCHEIRVKKKGEDYKVEFDCYKKVVGIDLGKRAVICSTGEKFTLPYIKLNETANFWDIKEQWKESVAMQLLLKYDILFLEYLENNNDTDSGFADMKNFPDILKEKAKLFNESDSVNGSYSGQKNEKEIYTLREKFASTQICHICGYKNQELGNNIYIRNWRCPYCGTKHDRDINAAINILCRGMEEKISKNKIDLDVEEKVSDKTIEIDWEKYDLSRVRFDI